MKGCKDCIDQRELCEKSDCKLPLFCKHHSKLWNNLRKNLQIEESQNLSKVNNEPKK